MKPINVFLIVKKVTAAVVVTLMLAAICPQVSAQDPMNGPDVIITITRLSETLDLVDQLFSENQKQGAGSPTAVVRGSLMGTAWIDSARPIVVGLSFSNGAASTIALVPYKQPNPDFQSAYSARAGTDYYVMAVPPNPDRPVTAGDEAALLAAGAFPQEKLVTLKIALRRLLSANSDKIDQAITNLEMRAQETQEGQPPPPMSPEDLRDMIQNSLAILNQVDTLKLDFDLNQETLSMGYELAAAADSRLAEVFAAGSDMSLFGNLPLDEQILFVSRSYNLAGMLELVGQAFGRLYKKIGVDFAGLQRISRSFTGEMLGGMSLSENRLDFEFMAVLADNVSAGDFLEKEYIPWLLEYGRQMNAVVEKAGGEKTAEPVTMTEESTVNGRRVLGCQVKLPVAAFPGPAGPMSAQLPISTYDMRMTTADQVLLVASDDKRVANLLKQIETMKEKPATGPLMTGEVDLAGYLGAVKSWASKDAAELPPLPNLGRMLFQGDMGQGRASFEFSIRLKDVQSLIAYAAAVAPAAGQPPGEAAAESTVKRPSDKTGQGKAEARPGALKVPPPREAVPVKKDAEYWTTRAYLCTTYGNDKAAIQFFKKAIALSPNSSNLYFQMGISYGELGYYQAALAAIDKAIALGGDKGLYYYGRGRVLMQSGKEAEGLAEIRKAAEMGEIDAIQYLEGENPKPAG